MPLTARRTMGSIGHEGSGFAEPRIESDGPCLEQGSAATGPPDLTQAGEKFQLRLVLSWGAVQDALTNAIGIVDVVGYDNGALLKGLEQRFGTGHIMIVARRQDQADRAAFRVDPRVDLRCEVATAWPHTTSSAPFSPPRRADEPAQSSCRSSLPGSRGP